MGGLTAWVVVGVTWCFLSTFAVVVYPLWESREALGMVGKGVIKDLIGGGKGRYVEKEEVRA